MDKLQKTFKEAYVKRLKEEIKTEDGLKKYTLDRFEYDERMVKYVANVYQPIGLLDSLMQTTTDYEAAILLYEAYKGISPVLASTEQFWVYLCHVDLYPYAKKRWGNEIMKFENIETHWFFGSHGYIRNALASLWWSVYCSYDEKRENPYELTEILFRNYSFRTTWLKIMLRTKESLLGILEFLKENPEIMESSFENRGRFIAKHINLLGGTKQLSYMNRNYIKTELYKIKPAILEVTTREDVQKKKSISIINRVKKSITSIWS